MSDVAFSRLVLASSAGLGVIVWGVLTALFAPRRWHTQAATAGAGAGITAAGVGVFTPEWWPVAVAVVALIPFGVNRLRGGLVSITRPRLAGGMAALLAAVGMSYEGWNYDRTINAMTDTALELAMGELPPATREAAIRVTTDLGTIVVLQDPIDPRSRAESNERDQTSPAVTNYTGHWIRRGPADDQSNCHGWVFAAGRYNLGGRFVNAILADNGYLPVSVPHAGDVCVYRDSADEVTHSAVVRGVLDDGTVMVEGKWGRLGVYLHTANDSCYGTKYTFYRSDRCGHTLIGLEAPSGINSVATSPAP